MRRGATRSSAAAISAGVTVEGRRQEPLAAELDTLLRTATTELDQKTKMDAILAVERRFNTVVRQYQTPTDWLQATNLRRALAPIAVEVATLRKQHPPSSSEGQFLAQLAKVIGKYQAVFQRW